jgi:hypothetical protein
MCAVSNMAVFCSSLTSRFPGTLLTYFLHDFEIFPVALIITWITFVFTFHMRCISIVRSLYFRIFSASFLTTFLFPEIGTSINIHVLFSLSRIIMPGLLLGMVLSIWTCWFYSMVTLLLLLSSSSSWRIHVNVTSQWMNWNLVRSYQMKCVGWADSTTTDCVHNVHIV